MVVEALSAILGGGVCIGVLLQGKKVKNDCCRVGFLMIMNLIIWISQSNPTLLPLQLKVLDFLMFHFPAVHLILVLGSDAHQEALKLLKESYGINRAKLDGNDYHDSVYPIVMPIDENLVDSDPLAVVPTINSSEAFPMFPVNQELEHSKAVFVAEVEALIQAVEKLGTGRWRDIKEQVFDVVKHRTYVDLKGLKRSNQGLQPSFSHECLLCVYAEWLQVVKGIRAPTRPERTEPEVGWVCSCPTTLKTGPTGQKVRRKRGQKTRKVTDPTIDGNAAVPLAHGMALISDELSEVQYLTSRHVLYRPNPRYPIVFFSVQSLQRTCKGQYRFCDPSNADCLRDIITYVQARHAFIIIYTSIDLHMWLKVVTARLRSSWSSPIILSFQCVVGLGTNQILEPLCPFAAPRPGRVMGGEALGKVRFLIEQVFRDDPPAPAPPDSSCQSYGYKLAPKWINDEDVQDGSSRHKGKYTNDIPSSLQYHANLSRHGCRSLIYREEATSLLHIAYNLISGELLRKDPSGVFKKGLRTRLRSFWNGKDLYVVYFGRT
ncbi:hypothetical protein SAY87_025436 [Trapa incisa]|uniref:Telomere repeat-binding protein 1-6-like ubiquitin-like domain-containing protein n=1 Tax=Trapa incisa TaxID=236973 RepID=A0AAN7JGQ5_9MYRT|nr:hypothetical protein SAY87_025436 [Trapa incisa]